MIGRAGVAVALLVVLVGSTAPPAGAHGGAGGDGASATSYQTRITEVDGAPAGLIVEVIDAGSRLELTNRTGERVVVLGYDGEPYLRIDAGGGVHENVRSPATYLNEDRRATVDVPPEADPDAEPEWRRIDGGATARWHDHRAHWMGDEDPPAVADDPGAEHVVIPDWQVPLLVGDDEVVVRGDLRWVPPPAAWPWYVAAGVLAVGVAAVARTRAWAPVLAAALVALVLVASVDSVDAWTSTGDRAVAKLPGLVAPVIVVVVAGAAVAALRRSPRDAVALGGAAAMAFALLFGFTSRDWLSSSQVPAGFSPSIARATVALSLGLGAGVVALAVLRLTTIAAPAERTARRPAAEAIPPRSWALAGASVSAGSLVVVVAAAAIAGSGGGAPGTSRAGNDVGIAKVHPGLCAALGHADAGDADRAGAEFDRVHVALHDLGAAAAEEDRATAARLLEAKEAVESALASGFDDLGDHLAALTPAVRSALRTTGDPVPDPCTEEDR